MGRERAGMREGRERVRWAGDRAGEGRGGAGEHGRAGAGGRWCGETVSRADRERGGGGKESWNRRGERREGG